VCRSLLFDAPISLDGINGSRARHVFTPDDFFEDVSFIAWPAPGAEFFRI